MSKPLHPFVKVVASAYPLLFATLFVYWLLGGGEVSPLHLLVLFFAVHFPAYVALLLEANVRYRGEALAQLGAEDISWAPFFASAILFRAAGWRYASLLIVLSLFLSVVLAFFLYYFSGDWRRGRVERVDVAGLVQGLAGLFMFHVAYLFVLPLKTAGEAFDLGAAAFWYFAMYPVLFYVYSAMRFALGRSCPAPLAAAAVAYRVSAAVENLALLSQPRWPSQRLWCAKRTAARRPRGTACFLRLAT